MPSGLILGIETSCDETAAAVVRNGTETLSSVVASQIDLHALYGGVVPELASREHLRNIVPVVREAIARAGISFADLDALAVTAGPGLAGALLVGITYAKSLAFALTKPLLAINHLEGHIFAVLMQHAADLLPATPALPHLSEGVISTGAQRSGETCGSTRQSELSALPPLSAAPTETLGQHPEKESTSARPLIALVVSGGHTHLYRADRLPATETLTYETLGRTVDDAAGEAFDKVAKLLGLPYPGGPWIDALAPLGDPRAIPFRFAAIRPRTPPGAATPGEDASSRPERSAAEKAAVATPNVNSQHDELSRPKASQGDAEVERLPSPPTSSTGPTPPFHAEKNLDFSFSGIKTAVLRHLQSHNLLASADLRRAAIPHTARPTRDLIAALRAEGHLPQDLLDLAASFQHAVIGRLLKQTLAAVDQTHARAILVTGGVAANTELRRRFTTEAAHRRLPIAFPTLAFATDNAAMIAAAAWPQLLAGTHAPDTLSATPQLRLGDRPRR